MCLASVQLKTIVNTNNKQEEIIKSLDESVMPAEIDTRGPRVLHCYPNCPSLISQPNKQDSSHHALKVARETWRQRKIRRRESKKNYMDTSNECPKVKATGQSLVTIANQEVKYLRDACEPRGDLEHSQDLDVSNENLGHHLDSSDSTELLERLLELPADESSHQCSPATSTPSRHKPNDSPALIDNLWLVNTSANRVELRLASHPKKVEKWTKSQPAKQSFFQLVLLLFLVICGHSGVTRPSTLEIVTAGTLLGARVVGAVPVDMDTLNRTERQANTHEASGTGRLLRVILYNRYLQIAPDGMINGTLTQTDYTIFRRKAYGNAVLIQALATDSYLCMTSCGLPYSSHKIEPACCWIERFLSNNGYHGYQSTFWSTGETEVFLALKKSGKPRQLIVPTNYTNIMPFASALTYMIPKNETPAVLTRLKAYQNRTPPIKFRHHHNSDVCKDIMVLKKKNKSRNGKVQKHKGKSGRKDCDSMVKNGTLCGSNGHKKARPNSLNHRKVPMESKKIPDRILSSEVSKKKRPNQIRRQRCRSRGPQNKSENCRKNLKRKLVKKKFKNSPNVTEDSLQSMESNGTQRQNLKSKRMHSISTRTTFSQTPRTLSTTARVEFTTTATGDAYQRRKFTVSLRNAVTTATKPRVNLNKMDDKSALITDISTEDTSLLSSTFEAIENPLSPAFSKDTSAESSEVESSLEDELLLPSVDYETSMTTMDTTSPERTEDYVRATTESLSKSLRTSRSSWSQVNQSAADQLRLTYGRLAM